MLPVGANAILEMIPLTFLYVTLPKENIGKMPSYKHFDSVQIPDILDLCLTCYFSMWPCSHGLLFASTSGVNSQWEVIPEAITENYVEGFCVEPVHRAMQSVIEFCIPGNVLWS